MLLPPPRVERDALRMRTGDVLRMLTGNTPRNPPEGWWTPFGQDYNTLHGTPEALCLVEPTHREGDYMGIPREPMTLAEAGLPPALIAGHDTLRMTLDTDYVLIQPEEQRLIDDIKKGVTAGELRKAIDRFMAGVYDSQIDSLAAKRREHTKRLIK